MVLHRLSGRQAWLARSILVTAALWFTLMPHRAFAIENKLTGAITNQMTGAPLENAKVALYTKPSSAEAVPRQVDSTYTNKQGQYEMKNIAPADYQLRVEAQEYRPATKDILISTHESVTFTENVSLLSKNAGEMNSKQLKARAKMQEALAAIQKKDYSGALDLLKNVVKLDPKYSFGYNSLGIEYQRANDVKNAEQSFIAAKDADPEDPAPLVNLGSMYNTIGKFSDAIPLLKKATELDGFSDHAFALLGDAYYKEKNFEEAEKALQQAYTLNPQANSKSLLSLGNIKLKDKEYEDARNFYKQYLEANPDDPNKDKIQKNIDVISEGLEKKP